MKFFGREISTGKIEIDTEAVSSESPELQKRLQRISVNYEKLESILTDLESKIAKDERLSDKQKKQQSASTAKEETDSPNPSVDSPSSDPKKPR